MKVRGFDEFNTKNELKELPESLKTIEGEYIKHLESNITLFSQKLATGENGEDIVLESKAFGDIYIFEKETGDIGGSLSEFGNIIKYIDSKFYAYNQYGEEVFLKGIRKDMTQGDYTYNGFRFDKINGEQVLVFEMSGMNLFLNQNGEKVKEITSLDKIISYMKARFETIMYGIKVNKK